WWDPHALEDGNQILGRDVPGRTGRDGAPSELSKGALERVDPLLERRQHVRQALAARVVEVGGELDIRESLPRRREELADLARGRPPGRIPEGALLAAEVAQPPGDLEDPLRRHLPLVGAAEAGGDHALAAQTGLAPGADRSLQIGAGLRDRAGV